MAYATLRSFLRNLSRVIDRDGDGEQADARLVERFVAARDEEAFARLVGRHGPMVLALCRRLLSSEADAEDAFQATFLVLARKAASIGKGQAVASWLYKVAYRVALGLRARRPAPLPLIREPAAPQAPPASTEVGPILDEEVGRLPEKYRAAVVLCYFQGRTHEEAARQLGCPKGTIAVRLLRARERLRRRLVRRGWEPAAAVAVTALLASPTTAALPATLQNTVTTTALEFAAGKTLAGSSATAVSLAERTFRTMFLSKMKLLASISAATVLMVAGLALAAQAALSSDPPTDIPESGAVAQPADKPAPAAQAKASASPSAVGIGFVHDLLVAHDLKKAERWVDPDAVRKRFGKGSFLEVMRRQDIDDFKKTKLKGVIFFTKDDIPDLRTRYRDNMWDRLEVQVVDGVGCLVLSHVERANGYGMLAVVIKPVNGEHKIVYGDDN